MTTLKQAIITGMLAVIGVMVAPAQAQGDFEAEEIWRYGRGVIADFAWDEDDLILTTQDGIWHVNITENTEPIFQSTDVNNVILSMRPDKAYFVTYDARAVLLWEAQTQQVITRIDAVLAVSQVLVWQPEGNLLALSVYDESSPEARYRVELWNVTTGERERVVGEYKESVLAMAWHPAGNQLAVRQQNGTITIEDLASQTTQTELQTAPANRPMLAWNGDGTLFAATATADAPTYIWRTDSFELISTPETPSFHRVLAWHDDHTRLAGDLPQSGLGVWDTKSNTLRTFGESVSIDRFVVDVAWQGDKIASLDALHRLYVWDTTTDERIWESEALQFHDNVTELAMNPQGSQLAIGYRHAQMIEIVDMEAGLLQETRSASAVAGPSFGTITQLTWSASGDQLAFVSNSALSILSIGAPRSINQFQNVTHFSWSANGVLAVWAGLEDFRFLNSETGQVLETRRRDERGQVQWSPNGNFLAYSYRYDSEIENTLPYGLIEIWDMQLNVVTTVDFSGFSFFAAQANQDFVWLPDSSGLIGYTNGHFWRWDMATEALTLIIGDAPGFDTTNQSTAYRVSPSGAYLAISNMTTDWQIQIVDMQTGDVLGMFDAVDKPTLLFEWASDEVLAVYDGILRAYRLHFQ